MKFKELLEEDVLKDTDKKLGEKNEVGRIRLELLRLRDEKKKSMKIFDTKIEALEKKLASEIQKNQI